MNILIIDNSVAFTGAFKCALNEAEILNEHRFVFVVPRHSKIVGHLEQKNLQVYPLPLRELSKSASGLLLYPFYLLYNLIHLRKIVRREKIDVVQVNDFYNLLGALLVATGCKMRLITYVRFLPAVMPSALRKLWLSAAGRYAHKIIAVSDAVLQQLPTSEKNVRIYDPAKLEEHLGDVGKRQDKVRLLYLANFTKGKGQEHALEALAIALKTRNDLELIFAGSDMGLEKNAAFRTALMYRAEAADLKGAVTFKSFCDAIEAEMKQADVLLNFSEAESFSMTCLEAAFYGLPVIATRCGGPEEIVDDGKTGRLVEKGNLAQMSEAILQLAGDAVLRAEMGKAAQKRVREKFSIENFKRSFTAILQQ